MGERLKGKSAVVTGAGRSIGAAIAEALAAEGICVVVNDPGRCCGAGRYLSSALSCQVSPKRTRSAL